MTLKRRITVLLLASLVIAAVAAVYYMPQWQAQTPSFSKGAARRGGAPATDPVPVLASAARAADVPVHLDGVGTARALNTVTVRPQVDGKIVSGFIRATKPLAQRVGGESPRAAVAKQSAAQGSSCCASSCCGGDSRA